MGVIPITSDQQRIVSVIYLHRRSKPITRAQLAAILDIDDRLMRRMIEDLVKVHAMAIGRGPGGYYWRRCAEDDQATLEYMTKKARAIERECRLLASQIRERSQRKIPWVVEMAR